MVKRTLGTVLAAGLLVAGSGWAPAAEKAPEGTQAEAPAKEKYRLRGVGILILDPRDPPEVVKEKLRQFLEQIRPKVPEEYQQEANRTQLEALIDADWGPGQDLPQLEFHFHPDVTVEMIQDFIQATEINRDSVRACPVACPLRSHHGGTIHLHLTRADTNGNNSILVLRFYGQDDGRGATRDAREQDARGLSLDVVENYSKYGFTRKPSAKLFGVGVVAGNPRVDPDWMAHEQEP